MSTESVKEIVKEEYGNAALRVTLGNGNSCCGHDRSGLDGSGDPITSNLYDAAQEGEVPETAIKASLGCGNPTALAELKPVKLCSISVQGEALMCCFPLAASARQGKHLVSI